MLNGLTQAEYVDLLMSVGTHRQERRLLPIRVSDLISKASNNQPLKKIAKELQLTPSVLKRFLNLQRLPPEIQNMVSWGSRKGTLNFSTAAEISSLSNNDEQSKLIKATLEHSLTKEEVIAVNQRADRGKIPLDSALDEILKLRPIVERQYLFIGKLPLNTTEITEEDCRIKLRTGFAKRFGATGVLSVSAKAGKYAILLSEPAAKNEGKQTISGEQIAKLVVDLFRC